MSALGMVGNVTGSILSTIAVGVQDQFVNSPIPTLLVMGIAGSVCWGILNEGRNAQTWFKKIYLYTFVASSVAAIAWVFYSKGSDVIVTAKLSGRMREFTMKSCQEDYDLILRLIRRIAKGEEDEEGLEYLLGLRAGYVSKLCPSLIGKALPELPDSIKTML